MLIAEQLPEPIHVANAAPNIPHLNMNTKMQSSMILSTVPVTVATMATFGCPSFYIYVIRNISNMNPGA